MLSITHVYGSSGLQGPLQLFSLARSLTPSAALLGLPLSFTPSPMARILETTIRQRKTKHTTFCHCLHDAVALSCIGMSALKVTIDQHTTIITVPASEEFGPVEWNKAVEHITGSYDWWFGEIAPGVDAYVITVEDEHGVVGSPDWQELPEVVRGVVLAGLGQVPAEGDQR